MDAHLKGQKRLPYVKLAFILICITAFLFSWIAYKVHVNQFGQFDKTIISYVQSFINPKLDRIVKALTDFGSKKLIIPFAVTLMAVLLFLRKYALSLFVGFTSGVGSFLNTLLKTLFHRDRPNILPLITESGYSFPSGHSMSAMIFYGSVAYVIVHLTRVTSVKWLGVILLFVIIFAIGMTRIYLGVHFPSDVIGGFSFGAMWLLICITIFRYYEYKKDI